MTQFSYKAVSDAGETLRGQMEAASIEEVIGRLQDQGHTPLEARPADGAPGSSVLATLFKRGPFSGDQLAQFTHQLATLLGAGQPLDRALTILLELPESESAMRLIERVRDRVRGGTTLSSALDEEHGVFPRLYISLVRAGEAGGSLEGTLRRLADYLERAQALRGSIVNALIYPAFLMVGVLGSLVLLLAYVVPQFVPIFEDMQVPIPWITQAVLVLGNTLQAWWWLILLLLGGGIFVWRTRL
ncbi:MAG: type II secretion system F family protein, partial [Rhodanobacter sp.]